MTRYFDDMERQLRSIGKQDLDGLYAWEREMVYDCSLASMLPNFPLEFREAVANVINKNGVVTTPAICEPDFETMDEHVTRLRGLSGDMHSLFHYIASNGGLSDSPRNYPRDLANNAEELRESLAQRAISQPSKEVDP